MSDSCNPIDCSPPGSSVHGISQARILEWVSKYFLAHKKEWNNSNCSNMDGPREYHSKWSKPVRERQISYDILPICGIFKKWTYFQDRNRVAEIENKFMVTKGERGNKLGVWDQHRNTEVKWSEVAQLCPTLCDPVFCSPPGSSIHGILQAIILEWVAISFSRGSSRTRDRTQVSRIVGRCFNLWVTREAHRNTAAAAAAAAKSLQSCPTLCDPIDGSPPGSPVPGILQARTLEWVAISFSNRNTTTY